MLIEKTKEISIVQQNNTIKPKISVLSLKLSEYLNTMSNELAVP